MVMVSPAMATMLAALAAMPSTMTLMGFLLDRCRQLRNLGIQLVQQLQ